MKRSDLFREYARVIDMCESTDIEPCRYVRLHGEVMTSEPSFTAPYSEYTFAIGICEGKPVFAGDVLYHKKEGFGLTISCEPDLTGYTWTKPDPYAELKAAQKAGNVVELKMANGLWKDHSPYDWSMPVENYRVKPAPVISKQKMSLIHDSRHPIVECTWTDGELTSVEILK